MKTIVNASVIALLLSSSSAIIVKDGKEIDDDTNIYTPRNSLEAIIDQEEDLKFNLYGPSMSKKDKKEGKLQVKKDDKKTHLPQSQGKASVKDVGSNPDDTTENLKKKKEESDKNQANSKQGADASKELTRTDTWSLPVVDFDKEYDHIGYTRQALLNDIESVKIKKSQVSNWKNDPFCKLHDWAVVHYKAVVEGQVVENSRTYEGGKPRVVRLGHFQATKCWDIALQQFKQGEIGEVSCPGSLDKGSAPNPSTKLDSQATDVGHVKTDAPVQYEFEMLECGPNPYFLRPAMFEEPMISGQCFYIVSSGPWGKGSDLAFQVDERDKYYPKYWGIYDIRIKTFEGRSANNIAQQFVYNDESHTIKSLFHPDTAIFEGANKNLIMYKDTSQPQQHWQYSSVHKTFTNEGSGNFIGTEQFHTDANIHTWEKDDEQPILKWQIEYCNEDHGGPDHGH